MQRTNKAFVRKEETNIHCVSLSWNKIEIYLQEMNANLLNNSKARLALIKVLKEQHKTLAEQAHGVLGKTACQLAVKRLLNKALQVRKEHAGLC